MGKLLEVPIKDIQVPPRLRKPSDDSVKELAANILENGLLTPITLVERDGKLELVAGATRLAAMKFMNRTKIAAKIFTPADVKSGKLDEWMLLSELSENMKRRDFHYSELIAGVAGYHNLMIERYGDARYVNDPSAWSLNKTAKALGTTKSQISNWLRLYKIAQADPSLLEYSSFNEAWIALGRLREKTSDRLRAEEHVRRVQAEAEASSEADDTVDDIDEDYFDDIASRSDAGDADADALDDNVEVVRTSMSKSAIALSQKKLIDAYTISDVFEGLNNLSHTAYDVVEIDPPYGVDLDVNKTSQTVDEYTDVPTDEYIDFMTRLLESVDEVTSPHSWIIVWHATRWATALIDIFDALGWKHTPPAIWLKDRGQTNRPDLILPNYYESFFYARKGIPKLKKSRTNIFEYGTIPAPHKKHPTERPVSLMVDVLSCFASVGDNILVPFAGSGNTLLAAADIGANLDTLKGFDIVETYRNAYINKVASGSPGWYSAKK